MTIVNHRTFVIKPGELARATEVLTQAQAWRGPYRGPQRLYIPMLGDSDRLIGEYEYESLADYETCWAAFSLSVEAGTFEAAMKPLEARDHHNEIRELVAANSVPQPPGGILLRWVRLHSRRWQDMVSADIAEFIEPGQVSARLTMPHAGWWGESTLEIAFKSLADYEARLAEWQTRPTTEAYWDAVLPNLRAGGRTEVWRILQS